MNKVVIINKDKCNPVKCGGYICMSFCPRNRAGDECIVKAGEKIAINEEVCISCGICVKKCPFNALRVINTPKELSKDPIHQFSKNSFRLYGLPIPKSDQVIGLLGGNGIGKSTAIQILNGDFKPNLGRYDQTVSDSEIIAYFQGTEAHDFISKSLKGELSTSYKPQYVEAIPKNYKGTVKQLLTKISPGFHSIVEELSLIKLLDTPINKVSGGELQRIAIAATILKKANTYFFDEPSSYLDIKQRLRVAAKLRGLKSISSQVFIVEHDLIMLDYMTDLIHVFFGEPGAFGITSHPYSTREGINHYLKGELPSENLRFRDKPIVYDLTGAESAIKREVINSWSESSVKLGNFSLKVLPGELREGEVVGILGENGIGKTTFARLLTGELEPDKGVIDSELKISYKPQYIKPESDQLVKDLLINNSLFSKFKHYFRHLSINSLMNKSLKQLSGGELQRVSIVNCLTKEADIYLLDEPSAHLDVEQRIHAAKALKDITRAMKKNAIVIDHDLMFIDYVCERLIVFTGEPAIKGLAQGPYSMRVGMNLFLKELNLTFRRDDATNRPRPNKLGSVKDREQKTKGEYYYT